MKKVRTNAMQKTLKHKATEMRPNFQPLGYSMSSSDSSPWEAPSGAISLLSADCSFSSISLRLLRSLVVAGWPVGWSDFSITEGSWLGARVEALDSFSERLLDIGRSLGLSSDSPMFARCRVQGRCCSQTVSMVESGKQNKEAKM
jgi:hypothetical protein